MLTFATLLLACSGPTDATGRNTAGTSTAPAASVPKPDATEVAPLPGQASIVVAPPPAPGGPPTPTDAEIALVADLERERADGGPPSEPLVARRHKVAVADVEAAEGIVGAYRESLPEQARAGLKRRVGWHLLAPELQGRLHRRDGFGRRPVHRRSAHHGVRACKTDSDFSTKLEKAVQDPIAALPAETSGYVARLGFNDEWSCTGWLDQQAYYDRAGNTVNVR